MHKRKLSENNGKSASKLQCSSTAQETRNEAKEKILLDRKERNRKSAAASRKKKDDDVSKLRKEVKRLTEINIQLMKVVTSQCVHTPIFKSINSKDSEPESISPTSSNLLNTFSPNSSEPAVFQ